MAITVPSTPAAVGASSITLPTHAVGDLIAIFAFNTTTTTPTKPSAGGTVPAWVDIDANAGANSVASRTVQFIATATNHTSGTWTNTQALAAIVLRGVNATTPIGGHSETGAAGQSSPTSPNVTMTNTDGTSMLLNFYGHDNMGTWASPPGGYTQQATAINVKTGVCLDTIFASAGTGASQGAGTSGNVRTATVEVLDAFGGGGGTNSGLFFTMFK